MKPQARQGKGNSQVARPHKPSSTAPQAIPERGSADDEAVIIPMHARPTKEELEALAERLVERRRQRLSGPKRR